MSSKNGPLIFGEVLYDCFPDGREVLGGAPFNVAWHCHAFGLNPIFVSRVGNDSQGEEITSAMREWGMDIGCLQVDDEHPTGRVEVNIIDGEPSYDIVANSAWDYIDREQLPTDTNNLLLYHGSLAMRNTVSRSALEWLKTLNHIPSFVDINLRAPWWEISEIRDVVGASNILKLNEEEAALISADMGDIKDTMDNLMARNSLDMLIVTQGEKGASVLTPESGLIHVSPVRNTHVVDTVGAGDAFSSIVLVGQYYRWPLDLMLERAQEFASAIVGIRGATINDASFYQPFKEEWQLLA